MKAYIDKHNLTPKQVVESSPEASAAPESPTPTSSSRKTTEKPEVDFEDIELSSMRRTIAKRLLESKVNQHFLRLKPF